MRLVHQQLPGRVRDVILAPDHMRDLHQRIVHDDGEVVGGVTVGANDDRIADHVPREPDVAPHEVGEDDVAVLGNAEAYGRALARGDAGAGLLERDVAAGARVHRGAAGGDGRLPVGIELRDRAEAVVRGPAASSSCAYDANRCSRSDWRYGPHGPPVSGPSSQSRPSHRRSRRIAASDSRVDRSTSVSSMRSTNVPPDPRASSQLNNAVLALPTWS